ncbi:hypothetical protein ABID53_003512 [Bacillus oleivorans]
MSYNIGGLELTKFYPTAIGLLVTIGGPHIRFESLQQK